MELSARIDPVEQAVELDVSPEAGGWVWLNGHILPADGPHLRVTDRGFQLGDGVFETLRARRGVAIELEGHLARLHQSAEALAISLPADSDERLARGIGELIDVSGLSGRGWGGPHAVGAEAVVTESAGTEAVGDAALRVTVSRGAVSARGLLPTGWSSPEPTIAIQVWPYAPPPPRLLDQGASAVESQVRRDPASPLSGIKSTSRADYVYATLEAVRAGADVAIFVTIDGRLSEATTANLFLVRDGYLLTPSMSAGILSGTTRTWLLAEARSGRLQEGSPGRSLAVGRSLVVDELDLRPSDLLGADEAFLTSSVAGIVPLTRFEGRPIADGRPGPITLALREFREQAIERLALEGLSVRRA